MVDITSTRQATIPTDRKDTKKGSNIENKLRMVYARKLYKLKPQKTINAKSKM